MITGNELTEALRRLDDETPAPGSDIMTLALHIRKIKELLYNLGMEREYLQ